MNRFRTKKKAKDAEGAGRTLNDSETPATGLKSSMTFRRNRRNNHESDQKPEFDVANALPSTDEFRTSLLMSGLSARFSMLREQDDPKSKLGKASDDSVLFPKRQSRLNDFSFQSNGLHDIAEVSSIKTSIRPPFLSSSRAGSYHSTDGYGTDDGGSIMSRAKPGEGNNLFGGRQKIYKIPVGGSSAKGSNMGGRALYEDDVSQSAFQKLREREREQREHELQKQSQQEDDDAEQLFLPNRSASPPLSGYNFNRETSSTTSSGPSLTRSSTAATSVTSQGTPSVNGYSSPSTPSVPNHAGTQGLDRLGAKNKRLYETGLDLHLHSQQYSAINRIDNLSRQQTAGTRSPSPTLVSPANTIYDSNHTTTQHPALRSASPPLSSTTLRKFDFGAKAPNNVDSQKPSYMSPPLSPPVSEGDDQTILPIQPNDRGKATALGTFSKPSQPYDEKKYTQRQLQMKEGREISPLRKQSPPRAFLPGQQSLLRARAESSSTYSSGRSRSSSSVQREHLSHRNFAPQASMDETPGPENQIKSGTFLSSPNGSTMSSQGDNSPSDGKSWGQPGARQLTNGRFPTGYLNTERPPESEHPANRQRSPRLFIDYTADADEAIHPETSRSIEKSPMETSNPAADSPTLGPATGLSGLVRQHLRTDSNASSVYGAPSPGTASRFPENPPEENTYASANHWEFNDWDLGQHRQQNGTIHAETNGSSNINRLVVPSSSASPGNREDLMDANRVNHKPSWEKDGAPNHSRDVSLETQKERNEFANELATRRMRVQANLRSRVESDSRSASPAWGADWSRDANSAKNSPMGPQKFKSGRGSIITRPTDSQSKAMKMLGIGQATISSSSSPNSQNFTEDLWKKEEEELLRGVKLPNVSLQTKQFRQARRDAQRDRERQVLVRHQQRGIQDFGDRDRQAHSPLDSPQQQRPDRLYDRRAPSRESKDSAASNQSGSAPSRNGRDRSSSDASARSKSRNGRYRDDLAKAMAEGSGSSAQGAYQDFSSRAAGRFPAVNGASLPHSPNAPLPAAARAGRSRSNSKSPPSGPFDNQLQPIQTNHLIDTGTSPRPSPVTPYSINSTPALAQPSPVGPGITTPTMQGFQNHGRIPAGRKRSVNKSDISEPTLVSKTSQITTVDLPQGASLQNGMQASAPPLPQMHPRRRQTRTQTLYGVLTGKGNDSAPAQSVPSQAYSEDLSTFSADEADEKKPRQKLRKISSEGGNLNSKARQAFVSAPSPALPGTLPRADIPTSAGEGTMF
jgi:hypothetical protein